MKSPRRPCVPTGALGIYEGESGAMGRRLRCLGVLGAWGIYWGARARLAPTDRT
jgi:hypothetical protein